MQFKALYIKDRQEFYNAASHFAGAILASLGLAYLIWATFSDPKSLLSVSIYGLGMIFLFSASTLYHVHSFSPKKKHYRTLDHIGIYYLIAGTYTPFLVLSFDSQQSDYMLVTIWILAVLGTIFKLFFTGRFEKVSLAIYLAMGWLVVLDFKGMLDALSSTALTFVALGGLSYTVGTIFYAKDSIRYFHFIWHLFVLVGAGFHYAAVVSIL